MKNVILTIILLLCVSVVSISPAAVYKGTATKIAIEAYDPNTYEKVTANEANITATVSRDGQSALATSDVNPTEIDSSGIYIFDINAAEADANIIVLLPATTCANTWIDPVVIYTEQSLASYGAAMSSEITDCRSQITDSNNNNSAAIAAGRAEVNSIALKTDNLPAAPAAVGSSMNLISAPNAVAVTAIQNGLAKAAETNSIALKTDNLPAAPAAVGSSMNIISAPNGVAVAAIQNGLATSSALADVNVNIGGKIADANINIGGRITADADPNTTEIAKAVFDYNDITEGGNYTFRLLQQIMAASLEGKWQDKSGYAGTYQIMDIEDSNHVIFEETDQSVSPQRTVVIK